MQKQFFVSSLLLMCLTLSAQAGTPTPVKQATLSLPFYMERTIAASPVKGELSNHIRHRQWKEAVSVAEKFVDESLNEVQILDGRKPVEQKPLINEWSWQATIGELYLFNLQPKIAIARFDSIRRYAPEPTKGENLFLLSSEQSENYNARLRAAAGLARAYAELGQWQQALNWHDQALKEELRTHWCGNGAEGAMVEAYARKVVWQRANESRNRVVNLKKVVNGYFKTMKVHLDSQGSADKFQKRHAAQEAYFLLGEIYLRQGNHKGAHLMFQKVCNGRDELERKYLAATYLDRIKLPNP